MEGLKNRQLASAAQRLFQGAPAAGFDLKLFDKPEPRGGGAGKIAKYRRAPHFSVMRWEKR